MTTQMSIQKESADYHLFYESMGNTQEFPGSQIHKIPKISLSDDGDDLPLKNDVDASTA
jgi:amino acid permease